MKYIQKSGKRRRGLEDPYWRIGEGRIPGKIRKALENQPSAQKMESTTGGSGGRAIRQELLMSTKGWGRKVSILGLGVHLGGNGELEETEPMSSLVGGAARATGKKCLMGRTKERVCLEFRLHTFETEDG